MVCCAMKITEQYGQREETRRSFFDDEKSGTLRRVSNKTAKPENLRAFLWGFFCDVFLPQGYPDSVTEDYLDYQLWDTLQAFASSITGTLATEAVLKGVGVGDKDATPLAATITWLLKDGMGMTGRILFAWAKGTQLDSDCKKWRLFADILNDVAIFLDLMAPHFRSFFTVIVCFSSLCRSIVGVAGGATRAAVTQHQAIRNNMADVSAKDGSQETLVNLTALICSLILIPIVSGKTMMVWFLFFLFTFLHLYANYRAVRSLKMNTLNQDRLAMVTNKFLDEGSVPDVTTVNRKELSLFRLFMFWQRNAVRYYGCSIDRAFPTSAAESERFLWKNLSESATVFSGQNFLINLRREHMDFVSVYTVFDKRADALDFLQAAFVGDYLRRELLREPENPYYSMYEYNSKKSAEYAMVRFPEFERMLRASGWRTDFCQLNCDDWRYQKED